MGRGTVHMIGPRSLVQLQSNLGALSVDLDAEQRALLDQANA